MTRRAISASPCPESDVDMMLDGWRGTKLKALSLAGVENKHSTDVESTNRACTSSVSAFTLKVVRAPISARLP
jgi:hypothetical protein